MKEKIEELKQFIEEYGEDFLGDGTKSRVIEELENENSEMALEILNSMDKSWIERAKKLKKILIFTDYSKDVLPSDSTPVPVYKANYIDSQEMQEEQIPVLRRVLYRTRDENVLAYHDYDEFER